MEQYAFPFLETIEPDKGGRPQLFNTPRELWEAAVSYFEWVEQNPLMVAEKASSEGVAHLLQVPKPRPMTIGGLCIFLGIARRTWDNYRTRDEFMPVIFHAEEVMRKQKFEWAAVGAMNANLISRDLGLADRQQIGGDPDNRTPMASEVRFVLCGQDEAEGIS